MARADHEFQFAAAEIASAAADKMHYHNGRLEYWQGEYETATARVEETIGARLEKHPITDGFVVEVVLDYGDPAAYSRLQLSFKKINTHRTLRDRYQADVRVYGTQDGRTYELTADDVAYFGLDGRTPEDE